MVILSKLCSTGNTQVLFKSLPQPTQRGPHAPPKGLNSLNDRLRPPLLCISERTHLLYCPAPLPLLSWEASGPAGPAGAGGRRCPQPPARARPAAAGRTHHVGKDLLPARRGAGQHHPLADQLPQHWVQHHGGGGRRPLALAPCCSGAGRRRRRLYVAAGPRGGAGPGRAGAENLGAGSLRHGAAACGESGSEARLP